MKRIFCALFLITILFVSGCSASNSAPPSLNSEDEANQQKYVDMLSQYYDFNFDGSELIELREFFINNTHIAKIVVEERNMDSFIGTVYENATIQYDDYDTAYSVILEPFENRIADHSTLKDDKDLYDEFVDVTKKNFDYAFTSFTDIQVPGVGEYDDYWETSRRNDVIVLKPDAGYITIYVKVDFVGL